MTATGSITYGHRVITRGTRRRRARVQNRSGMTETRSELNRRHDVSVAPDSLNDAVGRALATRRYTVLAALAAPSMSAPAVLRTSAPLLAVGRGSQLVATVTFAPRSCEFVAATAEDDVVREVFRGPSLPLACSAANQALENEAPLPSAIRPSRRLRYTRTRPAYEPAVHFEEALRRLGELAREGVCLLVGADQRRLRAAPHLSPTAGCERGAGGSEVGRAHDGCPASQPVLRR